MTETYAPEQDLAVRVVRAPQAVAKGRSGALVLRVRAKPWISHAILYASLDGESYTCVNQFIPHVVGGTLVEPMRAAEEDERQEIGPLVKTMGPDVEHLRVLSKPDWLLGRQVALIGDEWVFVRAPKMVRGGMLRLCGVLRGRWGSKAVEHPVGTPIYVCDAYLLKLIEDEAFVCGAAVWVKAQPVAVRAVSLTHVAPAFLDPAE